MGAGSLLSNQLGDAMSDDDEYVTTLGPACNALLMSLHTARRLLMTQIAAAKSKGTSTVTLERDLGDNRETTHSVLIEMQRASAV